MTSYAWSGYFGDVRWDKNGKEIKAEWYIK